MLSTVTYHWIIRDQLSSWWGLVNCLKCIGKYIRCFCFCIWVKEFEIMGYAETPNTVVKWWKQVGMSLVSKQLIPCNRRRGFKIIPIKQICWCRHPRILYRSSRKGTIFTWKMTKLYKNICLKLWFKGVNIDTRLILLCIRTFFHNLKLNLHVISINE